MHVARRLPREYSLRVLEKRARASSSENEKLFFSNVVRLCVVVMMVVDQRHNTIDNDYDTERGMAQPSNNIRWMIVGLVLALCRNVWFYLSLWVCIGR